MCSFFFNDTATTEIYTLSLHDALPICLRAGRTARRHLLPGGDLLTRVGRHAVGPRARRHGPVRDRKSTRLNSSHANISYAVFCLKKKKPFDRSISPSTSSYCRTSTSIS